MRKGNARQSGSGKLLDGIERLGNLMPDPATLFSLLALAVLIASWIAARAGIAVVHPGDGSTIRAVNLLDGAGVRRIFTEAVPNFTGFAPLGTVLVSMIGIGIAEAAGLVQAVMRAFVISVPRSFLTAAVVFVGVNGNLAADAGIIVLPPLAAMLFVAAGRHPLAGIAAAFAGVSGGFSANLLPSTLDVLLAGFTQEALDASRLQPGYSVQILGNYYFMVASTPLLTIAGTWVTSRFVEPRLGPWKPENVTEGGTADALAPLSPAERRGLLAAGVALALTVLVMLALILPAAAPLRGEGPTWMEQLRPLFDSMVVWVMIVFLVPGVAYGIATRTIRSDKDVSAMAGRTLATMGMYIVLAFAAAQFVNYFAWSNLGAILAISGADLLKGLGLKGGLLIIGFILLSAFIDLFVASASAKWAMMAPVFVPMFLLLGFSPEGTQAVFRIGDSCVNIITPLMPYMPFIITCAARYQRGAGAGTIAALMLPYSVVFMVLWTVLLLVFYGLGWQIGPGVQMTLPAR